MDKKNKDNKQKNYEKGVVQQFLLGALLFLLLLPLTALVYILGVAFGDYR